MIKIPSHFARIRENTLLGYLALGTLSFLFVFAVLSTMQTRYMDNDAVTILDYSMHGSTTRYSGILLTHLLHVLYQVWPSIAWYGICLYTAHTLCIAIWLSLIAKVFRKWWLASIVALIFLGYYVTLLVFLDYTSTGLMLCMASLTFVSLNTISGDGKWWKYLLLGLIFALGAQIRPQSALGSLVYMLPIGVCVFIYCARDTAIKTLVLKFISIALVFFIPYILNIAYEKYYRLDELTPQESQYDAFNTDRGTLDKLSRPRKRQIMRDTKLLQSIHWSSGDAYYFFNWLFFDERIYTVDNLDSIIEKVPPAQLHYKDLLDKGFIGPFLNLTPRFILLLSSLVFFLLIPVEGFGGFCVNLIGVVLPFYCTCLASLLIALYAFPDRVEFPFTIAFGYSSLLVAGDIARLELRGDYRRYLTAFLGGCVIGLIGMTLSLYSLHLEYPITIRKYRQTQDKLGLLNSVYQGDVIVLQPQDGLRLEELSPLEGIDLKFHPVQLGWSTFSTRFYRQIESLGIKHGYEMMDAVAAHDNAYLLGYEKWCRSMLRYISTAKVVNIELVKNFPDGTALYKIAEVATQRNAAHPPRQ